MATNPNQSSVNPLRELLNTILRELGETPYFNESETASVPAVRGPRKNTNTNTSGLINNTNVSVNFNSKGASLLGTTRPLVGGYPHTPNYNFLKQHLLDLTNWCLSRGSRYERVDALAALVPNDP
eukprot:PhF_6_TR20872/c0_g1_i1/m.30073